MSGKDLLKQTHKYSVSKVKTSFGYSGEGVEPLSGFIAAIRENPFLFVLVTTVTWKEIEGIFKIFRQKRNRGEIFQYGHLIFFHF